MLPWLWHKPAAAATPFQAIAWIFPYAASAALKKKKRKKEKKKGKKIERMDPGVRSMLPMKKQLTRNIPSREHSRKLFSFPSRGCQPQLFFLTVLVLSPQSFRFLFQRQSLFFFNFHEHHFNTLYGCYGLESRTDLKKLK